MQIPMHRYEYTKLTPVQIRQAMRATEDGPSSASAFTNELNGRSVRIVTQDGPTLEYAFNSNKRLTVSVDGARRVEAGYGELTLNQIVFFSHTIPGEQRGYNVYIDQGTNLVTVFEVWMSSGITGGTGANQYTLDDREVQRQIYFGHVDTGQGTPAELHKFTNRIEGKGIYWKQDNGIETLEHYASVTNTNFVELTRHTDNLSWVSTSDYVEADVRHFFYNRTECEFSGIHTCFAMDLFSMQQVGVRFGFNENDELEYYMFRGDGKVIGQLAFLEPFDEYGRTPMWMNTDGETAKGARYSYRPVRTFTWMSDAEVAEAAERNTSAFGNGPPSNGDGGAMAANNMPFSDMLVGREFTLRFDNGGPVRDYRVNDVYQLQYRDHADGTWRDAWYRAYEGDDNLAWFGHILEDTNPRAATMVAVDFTNGLVTSIESHMGTPYYGNETTYRAIFGVLEMEGIEPPLYTRHHLTDELIGHAFSWSYSDATTSMHLYTSPNSMSWTIFTANQTMGAQWCSPCLYVKLRPGIYIFCQNEEACNGAQMTELLNTKITRDCGFSFTGGANGVNLGLVGAYGRHIGQFDTRKYFGPNRGSQA